MGAGNGEDVFRGGGGRLVIDGRRDRRGRVGNRAECAVVGLQAVMLVLRGEEERAQEVEHEQPAEPGVEATDVAQSVQCVLLRWTEGRGTASFVAKPYLVNPIVLPLVLSMEVRIGASLLA